MPSPSSIQVFYLTVHRRLDLPQTPQLQSSASLTESLSSLLSSCPTTNYLLVAQPNLHAADIRDESGSCHMPNLCRTATESASVYTVAEVVGQLSLSPLASLINTACASAGRTSEITEVVLRPLPALQTGLSEKDVKQRRDILADNGTLILPGHTSPEMAGVRFLC